MNSPVKTKAWFSSQVAENQAAMFRVARSILHTDEDAEDAVQEAICSAYEKLDSLRDPERFKAWLLRILANQCYSACRRSRPTVALSEIQDVLPAAGTDSTERLTLWQAVESLPPDLRVTIALFYYEDCSIRQISGILGLSQAAVKTRLHRGRERLKQILNEEETA